MDTVSGLKHYHLSLEEIETMLQTQYGSSIQPVDYGKLQKLRKQQQQQAIRNVLFKNKHNELVEEPQELDELAGIEPL